MAEVRPLPVQAVGRAPGKVILVGEHAVVHGEPAIALPVASLGVTVTATPAPGPLMLDCLGYHGPMADAPHALAGLGDAAEAAFEVLGQPACGMGFAFSASLPTGRGLGSSAAAAVALVRALYGAFGQTPTAETLLALADVAERHAHGTPSGLDAATVAADGPIRFKVGEAAEPIRVAAPLHFVVADSGMPRDTRSAVTAVRHHLAADPIAGQLDLTTLGLLAVAAGDFVASGDATGLGMAMTAAQRVLSDWGVSNETLDGLISAAGAAGALGAKLTGAGRGGCMLALATDAHHQKALMTALVTAGAAGAWPLTLETTV